MNLRELVATLELGGKPTLSEEPVMVMDVEGRILTITDVQFEEPTSFEGQRDRSGTTWIRVEET